MSRPLQPDAARGYLQGFCKRPSLLLSKFQGSTLFPQHPSLLYLGPSRAASSREGLKLAGWWLSALSTDRGLPGPSASANIPPVIPFHLHPLPCRKSPKLACTLDRRHVHHAKRKLISTKVSARASEGPAGLRQVPR